ncbi:MAG: hypothetical protein CME19_10005 [Gemmatimonadetes bacterium]|nr:hypothetical protein [Gemmatimonadota bacterium]
MATSSCSPRRWKGTRLNRPVPDQVNIRIEESNDLDVIVPLNAAVQNEHHDRRSDWFKPFDPDAVRRSLEKMLAAGGAQILVAWVGETPAGYLLLIERIRWENALRSADRSLEIDQMSVEPQFRRHGIGRALVDRAKEIAKEESFDRIRLTVWFDNTGTRSFYESIGFKTFREFMELPV